jgi:hypothetical protein
VTTPAYRVTAMLAALAALAFVAVGPTPSPASADGPAPTAPAGPPTNVACLPFPEPGIIDWNGGGDAFDDLPAPYTSDADQTTVTWLDPPDENVTGYTVERQVNTAGWATLVSGLDPDTRFYTDTGLSLADTYRYRIRQEIDGSPAAGTSDICRKPLYLFADNFTIFYRTADCPPIDDADGAARTACVSGGATPLFMRDMLEGARLEYLNLGFEDPVSDPPMAVDLFPCDGGGCARSKDGTSFIGLTPDSIEPIFDGTTNPGSVSIEVHEAFHKVQGRYACCGDDPNPAWITEGSARAIEDKVCAVTDSGCTTVDTVPGSWFANEVAGFLQDPNTALTDVKYETVLFWTYLMERYGSLFSEPERGIDFMRAFLEHAQDEGGDGIGLVESTLDDLGFPLDFADVFADFAATNYTREIGPLVGSEHQYVDEVQGPAFGPLLYAVDQPLPAGGQVVGSAPENTAPWGAQYFRVRPDPAVPAIDIAFDQQLPNTVSYHVFAAKGGQIATEQTFDGADFETSLVNDAYDQVTVVVAGLEDGGGKLTYSFNGTVPQVVIVDPIAARPAEAGDPLDPDKILVKLEVLSPDDGSPIPGIDPATELDLTIGGTTLDLSDPEVLVAQAYVQGQYWMVLRPPAQPADGDYDLSVAYAGVHATEAGAVRYGATVPDDNVLVIDRSGSMADFDILSAAKDGGRLYVDAFDDPDQMGVVSFAVNPGEDPATTDLDLGPLDASARTAAFDAIDGLQAEGGTAIGAGLLEGLAGFDAAGDDTHLWSEILLSDGLDNTAPLIQEFLDEYEARADAGQMVPAVHTVALGPNADAIALQDLADATGGTFNYASEAQGLAPQAAGTALYSELAEIHREISETVGQEEQIDAQSVTGVGQIGMEIYPMQVDQGSREAVFAFNWSPPQLGMFLKAKVVTPQGQSVAPVLTDDTHQVWRIAAPAGGTWEVQVSRTDPMPGTYLVEGSIRADVTLFGVLGLAPEERVVGRPMPILASLSEGAGLPGQTVEVEVTDPAGAPTALTMFDDGAHGDGLPDDGLYGATDPNTFLPGSYIGVITASGTGPISGPFQRRLRMAWHVAGSGDCDGDGLPTWWEQEHGTVPCQPDGGADPDHDALKNSDEFTLGTEPRHPDSDHGGESDGSEARTRGQDPLDGSDDRIDRPRSKAWAGSGRVWVTYASPAPARVILYRGRTPTGPLTAVASGPAVGEFVDQNVQNGQTWCYAVVAVSGGETQSAPSPLDCVRPAADPNPPTGSIEINGGAPVTGSRRVLLTLRAGDDPTTAELMDPNVPPTFEGAEMSGVADMLIWNPGGEGGATWQPFRTQALWGLRARPRLSHVYIRFRDAAGNVSRIYTASIRYTG